MKKNKTIITFVLAVLLFSNIGCNDDFLETTPKGTLSDASFWKTQQDAEIFVNNLYNVLLDEENVQFDAMSDFMVANIASQGTRTISFVNGLVLSDNPTCESFWDSRYRYIRAANDFLANVELIPDESIESQVKTRLIAEAKFLRAYSYAYLSFLYGDVPLITTPLEIDESIALTRTPLATVSSFVLEELQSTADVLPLNPGAIGRISKGAALAMRARYALWVNDFSEAKKSAEDVIDLNKYSLYSSYQSLFSEVAENNSEVILDKQFIKNDYSNNLFQRLAPFSQNSGNNLFQPTASIVNEYEMSNGMMIDDAGSGFDELAPYDNRDPRLGYSVFHLGSILPDGTSYDSRPGGADDYTLGFQTTQTGFNLRKYVNVDDLADGTNTGLNFILIRYAEVLLTYAEAKIELNEIDQSVYDAINEIRARADVNMPPLQEGMTQVALRNAVRHERAVELAFEGLRMFDIKRHRMAQSILTGPIEGMTYEKSPGELTTVILTDYIWNFREQDYLWPIPIEEIILSNDNLTQNEGF